MPTLRKDPIDGSWVVVAAERDRRPNVTDDGRCPFCRGHEAETEPSILEIGEPWQVRVVANRFPAVRHTGSPDTRAAGPYEELDSVGAHEVIVESATHVHDLADLDIDQIERVLQAWATRLRELRRDPRFKCAIVFKNHGQRAGATVEHAHSQLIALPTLFTRLSDELDGARAYQRTRNSSLFDDLLAHELDERERVVFENDEIVVLAPFASRSPFELWLLPRRGEAWYENADVRTVRCLAEALRTVCRKLNVALDHPPYNLLLHSAPFTDEDMSHFTWHLELAPALTTTAGFERGTGLYINPTPPEDAARQLRDIEV